MIAVDLVELAVKILRLFQMFFFTLFNSVKAHPDWDIAGLV
jgi:hypothetical protein